MNAKSQSNRVRALALTAAIVMSTALFGGVAALAGQPAATIVVAQAGTPVQR